MIFRRDRARVIAQTDLFAGGSVRFPRRAAWLEEFTAELLAFRAVMTIRSMPSLRASHGVATWRVANLWLFLWGLIDDRRCSVAGPGKPEPGYMSMGPSASGRSHIPTSQL